MVFVIHAKDFVKISDIKISFHTLAAYDPYPYGHLWLCLHSRIKEFEAWQKELVKCDRLGKNKWIFRHLEESQIEADFGRFCHTLFLNSY